MPRIYSIDMKVNREVQKALKKASHVELVGLFRLVVAMVVAAGKTNTFWHQVSKCHTRLFRV